MTATLRKVAPGLTLLVLSPLVAEFLLGDFSIRQLGLLLVLIPQYGGGALLVREVARRARRGWPGIVLLALAYALIEEGFTTQSLFNPNYAGQRLLDYGYIPAIGTSLHWAVFVLTLHVVWSIGSCIAIAEGLAGSRSEAPWLGRLGLGVTALLFLLGCASTTVFTQKQFPFTASAGQFASVAAATAATLAAAFGLFRGPGRLSRPGSPPSAWTIGAVSLALCSGFHELYVRGLGHGVPPALTLAGMLALEVTAVALLTAWSRRVGWGPVHVMAAATGAILTYGWIGIDRMVAGRTALGVPTTKLDIGAQVLLLGGVLMLIHAAARRQRFPTVGAAAV